MFSRFQQPSELTPAERHQFVDGIMQETQEVLGRSEVQAELGARAVRLTELAYDYFVPNVRHGVVTIPQEYLDTDSIAILPIHGRPPLLGTDFNHITPIQRQRLTDSLEEALPGNSAQAIAALENERKFDFPFSLQAYPSNHTATVDHIRTRGTLWVGNNKIQVTRLSRNIVFLHQNAKKRARSPTICHELTHVAQNEERPILDESRPSFAQKELEAFHVGSIIERHIGVYQENSAIEAIRKRHSGAGAPFTPTFSMLHEIQTAYGAVVLAKVTGHRQISDNPPRYESIYQ